MRSAMNTLAVAEKPLMSRSRLPAHSGKAAPFLPMSRAEMTALGWDACDIVLVTGDAYVDHPSFGMAIIGRLLEAQGFRVGIIAQPDWQSAEPFKALGKPKLFFGVTGGNMDSMVNRYTADRRLRHDDAYTPSGEGGRRPDRCTIVYAQRCREAFKDVPIVLGGIEASLRRIAHFDYWSEKVRRSMLAECDPHGGDLVYRLPAENGGPLDPNRGLVSLAVSARRGLDPAMVRSVPLSAGVDLTAYRIIQEALTNAVRHAPGATASVRVTYEPSHVCVEVTNTAPARAPSQLPAGQAGPGYGLAGIAERVASCGGALSLGPTADGGFAVRSRLPLT